MSENVASFACGVPHPEYGFTCIRRRNHDAHHLARDEGTDQRFTWSDPVPFLPVTAEPLEATPEDAAEEMPVELASTPAGSVWGLVGLVVLVLLVLIGPAVVISAYRVALP